MTLVFQVQPLTNLAERTVHKPLDSSSFYGSSSCHEYKNLSTDNLQAGILTWLRDHFSLLFFQLALAENCFCHL